MMTVLCKYVKHPFNTQMVLHYVENNLILTFLELEVMLKDST